MFDESAQPFAVGCFLSPIHKKIYLQFREDYFCILDRKNNSVSSYET